MEVAVTRQQATFRVPATLIHSVTSALEQSLPQYDHSEVSLAFVNNKTIQRLNRRYRGKNAPTDVLSFSEQESDPGWPDQHASFLGEIVIAYPYARRQARQRQIALRQEITELMIHGFLHLVGFDHERPGGREPMERRERAILRKWQQLQRSTYAHRKH